MSQSDRLAIVVGNYNTRGTTVDDRLLDSTAAHKLPWVHQAAAQPPAYSEIVDETFTLIT